MRLLSIVVLVALASPGVVEAGFHEGMACGECHTRMSSDVAVGAIRPEEDLAVCIRCHDGRAVVPDVLGAASGAGSGAAGRVTTRSAGALNMVGDHGAGYTEITGHTMGSTQPPPGYIGAWPAGARLTCKSCHAPHPNGNYRNLGPDPLISAPAYRQLVETIFPPEAQPSYAVLGEETVEADVLVSPRDPYAASSVYLSTNGGRNAMNEFCASCHGAFHGAGNTEDGSRWTGRTRHVRHPTSGVEISSTMQDRIAASLERFRLARREDGTAEVTCLTCHRAHGTRNAFGLVHWDPRSTFNGEDGAAREMESLCRTCHAVGEEGVAARILPFSMLPTAE